MDTSKVKASINEKLDVAQMTELAFDRENILGNKENAGDQHFLHFPICLKQSFLHKVIETPYCVVRF